MTIIPDIVESDIVKVIDKKNLFFTIQTEKNEDILFYNYYERLKKFGFEWENTAIDFKFSLNLSKDEEKKL